MMRTMIKCALVLSMLFVSINVMFGQAKRPTVMVVPSDNWCTINGFMTEWDNQGTKVKIPDYKEPYKKIPILSWSLLKLVS